MKKEYFVDEHSVVRQIWGKSDTILFIFAGASAEFALNKAVDWLFFTGRLPEDPLGRLFSTVTYARAIVFSENQSALRTIDAMVHIHAQVETKRGATIPDWAYRDVLFLLIDYSIRSFELLERQLTFAEKNEVFQIFIRMGQRMKLTGLPLCFDEWQQMRQNHLEQHLVHSTFTDNLFDQYRKHLGCLRFKILLEAQTCVVPFHVRKLLGLADTSALRPLVALYKWSRGIHLDRLVKRLILPRKYSKEIKEMETRSNENLAPGSAYQAAK